MLDDIDKRQKELDARMERHSLYLVHEVLPQIERVERSLRDVWISDSRFKELGEAVAMIAQLVYENRTGKPIDSHVLPD